MKKLLVLLPLLAIISCDKTDPNNPYDAEFNSRGCLVCDNYTAGETFMIDGVRYEVADRTIIETAIADGDDLTRYCVSRISDISRLFAYMSFNGDVSNWDVSNVTNMEFLFEQNDVFNQDLSSWDVSSVTNMNSVFREATAFNQDISSWDVGNVTDMDLMFFSLSSFNQDLSQWCVQNIPSLPYNFHSGYISQENLPVWGTCP